MDARVRMVASSIQANRPCCPTSSTRTQGANSRKKLTPRGTAEAYMNGWRRPRGPRQRSDTLPAMGSVTASKSNAKAMAAPAKPPDNPSTWL